MEREFESTKRWICPDGIFDKILEEKWCNLLQNISTDRGEFVVEYITVRVYWAGLDFESSGVG